MIEINKDKIKQYECIVYRDVKHTKFSLCRIHKDFSGKDNLFYYDLKNIIRNPQISNSKDKGILFKIGIISNDSINSVSPIEIYTRLVIDYDNLNEDKNLIDKFKSKFKDYSYMLYTSFSSKKYRPKFRVIIKLKNPVFSEQLNSSDYRKYLMNVFTIGEETPDETCFMPYQLQLLPIVSNTRYYEYYFNKGKKLELDDYSIVSIKYLNKVIEQKSNFEYPDLDKVYNNVINKVKVFSINNEEEEVLNKNLSLVSNKNFNETSEYGFLKKEMRKKENSKCFSNKFEFNKYYGSMVAHNRITIEKVEREYKRLYGSEMKSDEKRYKDFLRCITKFRAN